MMIQILLFVWIFFLELFLYIVKIINCQKDFMLSNPDWEHTDWLVSSTDARAILSLEGRRESEERTSKSSTLSTRSLLKMEEGLHLRHFFFFSFSLLTPHACQLMEKQATCSIQDLDTFRGSFQNVRWAPRHFYVGVPTRSKPS